MRLPLVGTERENVCAPVRFTSVLFPALLLCLCVLSYQACQTLTFRRCLLLDSIARLPKPEGNEIPILHMYQTALHLKEFVETQVSPKASQHQK
ncbi:hypothetical protein F2P81_015723 [Scophthalmus maximus]|uniref:Uncharacterized protein n=1 Tax=Scophthalmus maximus TaxID=52904 RepID=A0A6A4SG12_SCOMX|nr:hypothetical protein F2P81_015723 [Scophthalmus maximus]